MKGSIKLKSEYSKNCPNTIINDLYYYGDEDNGANPYGFDGAVLDYLVKKGKLNENFSYAESELLGAELLNGLRHMDILNAIDWYAFIHYSRNVYITFIGIDLNVYRLMSFTPNGTNRPMYLGYMVGSMNGRDIEFIPDIQFPKVDNDGRYIVPDSIRVITMDPWAPKHNCKKCNVSESMDFFNHDNLNNTIKGIHVDKKTNEPFFGFTADVDGISKLYDKFHYTIGKNLREKNFTDMKDNLSLSFYAITTIDNDNENTDIQVDINIPDTQELKRLRSLLISDFKSYLGKLEKEEPSFDFLSYFFNNRLANDTKEARSLFTKTYETIMYW
jgi:hypothetical protein